MSSATVSFGNVTTSSHTSAKEGTVTLTTSGAIPSKASNVAFAVVGDGTSDHRGTTWHQATRQSDGSWTATVKASRIGSGRCTATAYATVGGTTRSLTSTSFAIGKASGNTEIGSVTSSQALPVRIRSLSCTTGIKRVTVGVFNGSASRWYTCTQGTDGSWSASVPLDDFGYAGGTYVFEAAIIDSFGNTLTLKQASKTVGSASATVNAEIPTPNGTLTMSASGGAAAFAWGVSFAVTDSSGSVQWIAGTKQSNGSWTASLPASYLTFGAGTVRAYANAGTSTVSLGSDYFNRVQPANLSMSQYIQGYASPYKILFSPSTPMPAAWASIRVRRAIGRRSPSGPARRVPTAPPPCGASSAWPTRGTPSTPLARGAFTTPSSTGIICSTPRSTTPAAEPWTTVWACTSPTAVCA